MLLDPGVKYTITCTGINERTLEDTPAVRGMINKVSYLVKVL